jgi:YesN/AraC family two-component response regulator
LYNWKTLIVDDETTIIENLKNFLQKVGLIVTEATSFEDALTLIKDESFELAILDISLPDGNGIDLFRFLREKNNEIYTIMITGHATIENAITALNEGVNAYLVKPFSDSQLNETLIHAEKELIAKSQNKNLFEAIENNRQFYENLLNSTSEAILVIDLDYRIRYCNQTASSLLELDDLEKGDQYIYEYFEDGYKIISHIYSQMVEGRIINGFKSIIKNFNGDRYDVHLSADFLYGKNKEIEGLIITVSNPAVYNELLSRVIRQERLSTVTNLANTLSHIIRNPINILSGRLQLIEKEFNQEKFGRAYETIQRQIDRILTITELLGKFNFMKEDTIPEKCNIIEIFKKVLKEKEKDFNDKNISLKDKITHKRIWTEGNQYQFADAFGYLISALINLIPAGNSMQVIGKKHASGDILHGYEIQLTLSGTKLSKDEIYESSHKSILESERFLELEVALMDLIFNNFGIKFDSIIQTDNHTLVRIQIPIIQNKQINKLKLEQ